MSSDKPLRLRGQVRLVPVSDVDTDMIFHNRHLHITDPAAMAPLMFGNLKGYEDFPRRAQRGDILIVGANFGCGSSRQQAVDGFIALGIKALVGRSFGAIYKRNAINAGLPLIECEGILSAGIKESQEIELNLDSGLINAVDGAPLAHGKGLTSVQKDIYFAGGLLETAQSEA